MAKGITWPGYEGEPRHFTGVPGVYAPGVVIALSDLGMNEAGARERIAGTPLAIVDMEAAKPAPKEDGE